MSRKTNILRNIVVIDGRSKTDEDKYGRERHSGREEP
jgi:hypothetical protein